MGAIALSAAVCFSSAFAETPLPDLSPCPVAFQKVVTAPTDKLPHPTLTATGWERALEWAPATEAAEDRAAVIAAVRELRAAKGEVDVWRRKRHLDDLLARVTEKQLIRAELQSMVMLPTQERRQAAKLALAQRTQAERDRLLLRARVIEDWVSHDELFDLAIPDAATALLYQNLTAALARERDARELQWNSADERNLAWALRAHQLDQELRARKREALVALQTNLDERAKHEPDAPPPLDVTAREVFGPPEPMKDVEARLVEAQDRLTEANRLYHQAFQRDQEGKYRLAGAELVRRHDAVIEAQTRLESIQREKAAADEARDRLAGWTDEHALVLAVIESGERKYLKTAMGKAPYRFYVDNAEALGPLRWGSSRVQSELNRRFEEKLKRMVSPMRVDYGRALSEAANEMMAEHAVRTKKAAAELDALVGFVGFADRLRSSEKNATIANYQALLARIDATPSDKERLRLHEEVWKLARSVLEARGIPFLLEGNGKELAKQNLRLLPTDEKSGLGIQIKVLRDHYDAHFLVDPFALLSSGAGALYGDGYVSLPLDELGHLGPRVANSLVQHELSHFHWIDRAITRLLGRAEPPAISAMANREPSRDLPLSSVWFDNRSYGNFIDFTELEAFYDQARTQIRSLRDISLKGEDDFAARANTIYITLAAGEANSDHAYQLASKIEDALKSPGSLEIDYRTANYVPDRVVEERLRREGKQIRIKVARVHLLGGEGVVEVPLEMAELRETDPFPSQKTWSRNAVTMKALELQAHAKKRSIQFASLYWRLLNAKTQSVEDRVWLVRDLEETLKSAPRFEVGR